MGYFRVCMAVFCKVGREGVRRFFRVGVHCLDTTTSARGHNRPLKRLFLRECL